MAFEGGGRGSLERQWLYVKNPGYIFHWSNNHAMASRGRAATENCTSIRPGMQNAEMSKEDKRMAVLLTSHLMLLQKAFKGAFKNTLKSLKRGLYHTSTSP